jgi:hypothetical protein
MMRTILALASGLAIMAACAPAEACISCSYTPEVLNSSGGGSTHSARPSKRVREYTEQRERRSSKKHVAKEDSAPKERKKETAKSEAKSEPTSTADVAPVKSAAQVEHSGITTTGAAIANQVKAAITPASTGPQTENSTISTAAASADKNIGCKKYFPSTGLTLSVPCE